MNNWLKTCNISGWITINHQPEPMSFLGRLPLLSLIHCCVLIHLHTPTQHEKTLGSIAKPWCCISSQRVLHFRSFLAYLWSYPHRFGQNPHLLKHDPLLCEISSCCAAKALVNCLCGHRQPGQPKPLGARGISWVRTAVTKVCGSCRFGALGNHPRDAQ